MPPEIDVGAWLPVVAAALTLTNTIVLFLINHRTRKTQRQVNGMKWQEIAEAERRGARSERHRTGPPKVGE